MGSPGYDEAAQKALEEALLDVGNKLLKPPSSIGELLNLLEKAEDLLAQVYQKSPRSTEDALFPAMKALILDEILLHADLNIQVVVASCTNELTRISAPDYPYSDDHMKEIFKLFMVAFKQLSSESGINYIRALRILETVAAVRSCLIMLDIEIDAMVVEMFQLFLDTIRPNHSSDMFDHMKTIMTLVIEESDEISSELLMPLLSSVKMDNKNTSPMSWELGKTVFENCATKLQNCVREAVKAMNLNVDEYAEIVASLCQDTSIGKDKVANEEVASVQFVTAGVCGDGVSKLDESSQAEQEDSMPQVNDESGNILTGENSLETIKCSQHIVQLKSNNARSDIEVVNKEEIVQSETNIQVHRRRRGRKPNSLMRPEEGYQHTWLAGYSGSFKASYHSNKKEEKDSPLPLELGNANMPSDSSRKEFDSVNEVSIGKRGQSKNKESMMNQDNAQEPSSKLRRKILQSKAKGKGSNIPKKTTKRVIAGSSTVGVEKGQVNQSATDSQGKDENEILSQKHESRDVVDQVVASPMSKPAKAKYPGNLDPEKEKAAMDVRLDYGAELVSSRIMVWWPLDKTYYTGTVEAFDPVTKKHKIKYDDDEEEVLDMSEERWELFNEKQPRQIQSSGKQEADDTSPAKEPVKTQRKTTKRKSGSSKKQDAASSLKRLKGEGRSLVKSGHSAPESILMNDESDDETDEANFSPKDDGKKKQHAASSSKRSKGEGRSLVKSGRSAPESVLMNDELDNETDEANFSPKDNGKKKQHAASSSKRSKGKVRSLVKSGRSAPESVLMNDESDNETDEANFSPRDDGKKKQHAASSSKRSKGEGRSLVKSGRSAPESVLMNDESDNETDEANFSPKDDGKKKQHAASSSKRSKGEGRSLVKFGRSAPESVPVNDESGDETREVNFSPKDDGKKKRVASSSKRSKGKGRSLVKSGHSAPEPIPMNDEAKFSPKDDGKKKQHTVSSSKRSKGEGRSLSGHSAPESIPVNDELDDETCEAKFSAKDDGKKKQHAVSSSKRSKGKGRSLVKSGHSAPESLPMNDKSDAETCEAKFSPKDDGKKKQLSASSSKRSKGKGRSLIESGHSAPESIPMNNESDDEAKFSPKDNGKKKHVAASSKRSKGEGHSLVKSGHSAPESIPMNDETCEEKFLHKDHKKSHAGKKASKTLKRKGT